MKHFLSILFFLFCSSNAFAQNAGLDPSFAKGGILIDSSNGKTSFQGMVILPDGKIIATSSNSSRAYLCRYLPNGTPDSAFGSNGSFRIDGLAKSVKLYPGSVYLQPDGSFLIGGDLDFGGFLMRLLPNGSIDSTFGNNGLQLQVYGHSMLRPQADGKLLAVVGDDYHRLIIVQRFTKDGGIDSSFGANGIARLSVYTSGGFNVAGIGKMADGRIVIAGGNQANALYMRLDSNGKADSSVCGSGVCYVDGAIYCRDAIIYPDGSTLIAEGGLNWNTTYLAKLKPDATPDSSFGTDGVLVVPDITTFQLIEMPDKRILCAGHWDNHFAVARVLEDGRGMDTTFGNRGVTIINIAGARYDRIGVAALQTDGKIVAVGTCSTPDKDPRYWNSAAVIVRYLPDAPLGVPKAQEPPNGRLKVYPNPTSTSLRIEVPSPGLLQLYSSEGRLLRQQSCSGPVQGLDIAALPTGTYFLRLQMADKSYSSLFIKE